MQDTRDSQISESVKNRVEYHSNITSFFTVKIDISLEKDHDARFYSEKKNVSLLSQHQYQNQHHPEPSLLYRQKEQLAYAPLLQQGRD